MSGHGYNVKDNDWISKIALELKQLDGGEKLWQDNPHLVNWTGNNRHVLDPGWALKRPLPPPPAQRNAPITQISVYKLPPYRKKQLVLTFYEHLGGSHPSVECLVYIGNKQVYKDDSFTGKIVIPFIGKNDAVLIDESKDTEATVVVQVKRRGVKHGPPQKIKLYIGGLTPLSQQDGSISVKGLQKILTNLGYAPGKADGIFGHKTQAAIRALQADHHLEVTGVPDRPTVGKLLDFIETPMRRPTRFPGPGDAVFPHADDPAIMTAVGAPLPLGDTEYFQKNALWDPYEAWTDRTAPAPEAVALNNSLKSPYRVLKGDQTGLRLYDKAPIGGDLPDRSFGGVPKEGIRFFPEEVYVAPSDEGDETNKNPIWMLKYRNIFLDCGGWIKDQLDFAVIHGWHVYLCNFIPRDKRTGSGPVLHPPVSGPPRMDHKFFQAMGDSVTVKECVSVVWPDKREFDWQNVTVIIPDLHLMTGVTASIWKNNTKDDVGEFYDLRAELNLFAFARQITASPQLQQHVQIIQLGDTYDLWIGSPETLGHTAPLFCKNKTSSVDLEQPQDIHLASGGNYAYDKDKVANRWADCGIDPNFDPSGADMRHQVLQWWVEAIQGLINSPVELASLKGKPDGAPWVKWLLQRRSRFNTAQTRKLGEIRLDYQAGRANGNEVAERLQAAFPAEFENVPDKPAMLRNWKLNPFRPDALTVQKWFNSIEGQLGEFEKGCIDYVRYVNTDLNDQWLNPAEAALRIFKSKYGIQYLYGNHDNYLIRSDVRGGAIDPRVRFIEGHGVFIEHAHRLEPGLAMGSANFDGNPTGFGLTDNVWDGRKQGFLPKRPGVGEALMRPVNWGIDVSGEPIDAANVPLSQLYYRREAGRFFVARSVLKDKLNAILPHIFVIGHTHAPLLKLNYIDLNDAADFRGPGNQSWGDDGGI